MTRSLGNLPVPKAQQPRSVSQIWFYKPLVSILLGRTRIGCTGWSAQAKSCTWGSPWSGALCSCPLMPTCSWSGWSICEPNWTPRSLCWVCCVCYQQSDPEFPARSMRFQTPWQRFLSEENCFPVRFSPRFICCVVKFVSVSRLNCGKDKSPDTNGFVAGRCSFSLLFEIIPFESHCYLHY